VELIGTAVNAMLLLLIGALLSWQISGRFRAFESRMDRLDDRMDRIESRMDGLQALLDCLRSDVTQVALAVGAKPRTTSR